MHVGMKDAPRLYGRTACRPSEPPTGGRPLRPGKASSVGAWTGLLHGRLTFEIKDAPHLYGFTVCKPTAPPTGGRAGRLGAAVRGMDHARHA